MVASRLLRTLSVENRALLCARSFDEVHRALIDSVPALKPEVVLKCLFEGRVEKVALARRASGRKLWLFLVRNPIRSLLQRMVLLPRRCNMRSVIPSPPNG